MNGTIKTKTDKDYGFISREGEEKDLFFHSTDLNGVSFDELQVGTAVAFDIAQGDKGPSAKNVRLEQAEAPAEEAQAETEAEATAQAEAPAEESADEKTA